MFCSNCGYQLEEGMRVCPQCGTVAGTVSVVEGNAAIAERIENARQDGGYMADAGQVPGKAYQYAAPVRKGKKKLYLALMAILVVTGSAAFLTYRQYRNNVKELQAYLEQGLIDEAREKADGMPKWQAKKAFDKINHDIQAENNSYLKENTYDAAFYAELQGKALALHEMEELDESTVQSMPQLQRCYEETVQNDALYVAEGYLSFLQEIQAEYDASAEDKIHHAQEVRSAYEEAQGNYDAGKYQEALDICQAIAPDEADVIYIESVAALLENIGDAYTSKIEENMQRAIENKDYETMYQFIKAAKDGSQDKEKYSELENQYLDAALKEVKRNLSSQDFEYAYDICKAVADCMPDNEKVMDLFVETVQGYVKNQLAEEEIDAAEEILAEALGILPEQADLTALQEQMENGMWRLAYDAYLTELHSDQGDMEFTLYPAGKLEIPYLLVISGNTYSFYKYDEENVRVASVAQKEFDTYAPSEKLFFHYTDRVDNGYFAKTFVEVWNAYSFDGKEFVFEYDLRKAEENHYEAFTNKILSSETRYQKDDEPISEEEYNQQMERIEKSDGMKTYSYSEENIKALLYNDSAK